MQGSCENMATHREWFIISLSLSLSLSQVKLMIEIELSYMNTNHPDFIGFDRCEL